MTGTPDRPSSPADPLLVGRILELVRATVGVGVDDPTADLLATGIIDSLAFVSLLLALEESFAIVIELDEIDFDDFRSVERIARYVAVRMQPLEPRPDRDGSIAPDED